MSANLPALNDSAVIAKFIDAMHAAGLRTDAAIIPDGVLHRFRVEGDKSSARNGYYTLHLDGVPAGHFGSWKHGISQSWCVIDNRRLTPAQREDNRRRMDASRKAAADLRDQKNKSAAARAVYLWNQAKPAPDTHPYLVKKAIAPGIARALGDALVLPIQSFNGELKSLQFIQPDGAKRLLSGGAKTGNFILVQSPDKPTRTMIAEGWATAQTLAEIEPQARVLAAVDASNLEAVAVGERKQWPGIEIVIALDFDAVGRTKGEHAARASGGLVLPPPDNLPPEITDWNDYALVLGGAQ